jgi:hypothetical protein
MTAPSPERRVQQLIDAYQKMADLTRPECNAETCQNHKPYRCCEDVFCEDAIRYARNRWDTDLEMTDHPTLPLMGPNGCTAPPHMRPICTVHTCAIASAGRKRDDPEWTKRYYILRDTIDRLEAMFDVLQLPKGFPDVYAYSLTDDQIQRSNP